MFRFLRKNSINEIETDPICQRIPTEEIKERQIAALRTKIESSETYQIRIDDSYMTRWLALSNWEINGAHKRLIRYHKFKKEHPDWYFSRHVSAYEQLLRRNMSTILNGRDKNGRRVYLMHINRMNTDEVTIEEMAQIDTIWMEMIYDEPETLENGVTIVIDMKGVCWKILKWFTPQNSYYSSIFASVAPLKSFDIHIINTSTIVHSLAKMILPFMTQYIKEKIHFHGTDLSGLTEVLGDEVLPEEYGGKAGIVDYNKLQRDLYAILETKEELPTYSS